MTFTEFERANAQDEIRQIALIPELLDAVYQYRNDLLYPPAPDSKERRLSMIAKLIAKVENV